MADAVQPPLWRDPVPEPGWRTRLYGPVHPIHNPECGLDPRHHIPPDPAVIRGLTTKETT